MSVFTEYDYQQMHVNAARMPLCVGKLRKIAHMDSNWEYYYYPQGGYCMAVAKPESGAETSTFGKISYVRQLVREGRIKPSALTKYGRRLLRV